jgi:hypothetical protein
MVVNLLHSRQFCCCRVFYFFSLLFSLHIILFVAQGSKSQSKRVSKNVSTKEKGRSHKNKKNSANSALYRIPLDGQDGAVEVSRIN